MVVQLGSGMSEEPGEAPPRLVVLAKRPGGPLLDKHLVTNVPLNITLEKLRGFVADHQAEITKIEGEQIDFVILPGKSGTTPAAIRSSRGTAGRVTVRPNRNGSG